MKQFDVVISAGKEVELQKINLANGYISTTSVFFEGLGLSLFVEAKGNVEVLKDDDVVARAVLPEVTDGKGVYDMLESVLTDGVLELRFPVYQWIDNYPHCDGEHDRWDTRLISQCILRLNLSDFSVSLQS